MTTNKKTISIEEVKQLSAEYLESVKALSLKKLGKIVHPHLSFDLHSKKTLGLANWVENTIYINIDILKYNPDQLKNTVIHEYCHILDKHVFKEFGHGKTWRKLMVNLGGDPSAKVDNIEQAPIVRESDKKTYYAYACDCNKEYYLKPSEHKKFLQKTMSYSCKNCKSVLKFKKLTIR